jgi:hypothetical protein
MAQESITKRKTEGGDIMQVAIDLKHLSRAEKLMMMETLWDDLSRNDEYLESPSWHEKALSETERRLEIGQEKVFDWQEAKKELRSRIK